MKIEPPAADLARRLCLGLGFAACGAALAQTAPPQQVTLVCTITRGQDELATQNKRLPLPMHFKVDYRASTIQNLDSDQPMPYVRISDVTIEFSNVLDQHFWGDFTIDRSTGAFSFAEMADGKPYYTYTGLCEPARQKF